jgi:hypothetical protein
MLKQPVVELQLVGAWNACQVGFQVLHDFGASKFAGHLNRVQRLWHRRIGTGAGEGGAVLHQTPHAPQVSCLNGTLHK